MRLFSISLPTHILSNHKVARASQAAAKLHKFCDVELRLLQNLHFPYKHIFQWKYALSLLLNFLTDRLWNQLFHELTQLNFASFVGHDLGHLLANLSDLRSLSVTVRFY